MKVTKAIIAVAGYGTRRLPITKSIEKCMLPLLNRPLIDYVVQDCIKAGITDIYFVVSNGGTQLRDYYERDYTLESYLERTGKTDLMNKIRPPENVTFHFVEQDQQDPRYGTTVPVWLCRDYMDGNEPFAIIMGDQCFYHADGTSELGVLIENVNTNDAQAGMVAIPLPDGQYATQGGVLTKNGNDYDRIVEFPQADDPQSSLINGSLYVVGGDFMEYIEQQMTEHRDGEYFIIDAVNNYVAAGNRMIVQPTTGLYCDCGKVESWVAANNELLKLTTS